MGKGMEKERRKVQMFTAQQVEGLRTYLAQKGTEPLPQPEKWMMREVVRTVYPELRRLRENGYSLTVLVRVLEENGVVITTNALSTYMTKLASAREESRLKAARNGSPVATATVERRRGQFQVKAGVPL